MNSNDVKKSLQAFMDRVCSDFVKSERFKILAELFRRPYFFNSAKISSTVFFASPKHITLFSLKNSGFCTPA
nr:MAG TPA: hypothetical protein [Caudoviricetes sp.]